MEPGEKENESMQGGGGGTGKLGREGRGRLEWRLLPFLSSRRPPCSPIFHFSCFHLLRPLPLCGGEMVLTANTRTAQHYSPTPLFLNVEII